MPRLSVAFVILMLLASDTALGAKPLPKKKVASKKPPAAARAVPAPVSPAAEHYSPTRCEWLAVELNSNFRETNMKNAGYTLQIYCRAPNSIFLAYRFIDDAGRDAALAVDDAVRAAVTQVTAQRGWRGITIDGEMNKPEVTEAGATRPVGASSASGPATPMVEPKTAPARPSGESGEDTIEPSPEPATEDSDETKPIESTPPAPTGPSTHEE